jgi:hypothetical protein
MDVERQKRDACVGVVVVGIIGKDCMDVPTLQRPDVAAK